MQDVIMGTIDSGYKNGKAQMITLCVTEECNLRCKYCYMTEKNSYNRMSFEVAKKAVDFLLSQEPKEDAVVWDFIGGEPTLEMELIDKISDYIKQQMFVLDHPWFNDYMFNIGTNGLLYRTPAVQNYIMKNRSHVSIGITIDGIKEKHDMMRVKKDGSGSYDDVIESVKLWQTQFPGASTKVTFASDDLKYLKDSIIHLWELGLDKIPANVVFEDVWKPGDDVIYEEQLKSLADYIIENKLYFSNSVRFFDPNVGFPLGAIHKKQRFCGTGRMIAVDCKGNLFPCIRFLDFCIPDKKPLMTGNIYEGFNENVVAEFGKLSVGLLNDGECKECEVASGCFSCTGCNYMYSDNDTIFKRTKFHCNMHKAQVRANNYFWSKFAQVEDRVSPYELNRKRYYESEAWSPDGAKYLFVEIGNNNLPHCCYELSKNSEIISTEILHKGLRYAERKHMVPVYLGDPYEMLDDVEQKKLHVVMSDNMNTLAAKNPVCEFIPIYSPENIDKCIKTNICILVIKKQDIPMVSKYISSLERYTERINIKITDINKWENSNVDEYKKQLLSLNEKVKNKINVFDHERCKDKKCRAGISEYTLTPDGKVYLCAGHYHNANYQCICEIEEIENQDLCLTQSYDKSNVYRVNSIIHDGELMACSCDCTSNLYE